MGKTTFSGPVRSTNGFGGDSNDEYVSKAESTLDYNETWGASLPAILLNGESVEAIAAGGVAIIATGTAVDLILATQDQTTDTISSGIWMATGSVSAGTADTGPVNVRSGDSTGGDSGLIQIRSGTGTNRGSIRLNGSTVDASVSQSGLLLKSSASDPTIGVADGMVYYNSTSNKIKVRANGAWETVTSS